MIILHAGYYDRGLLLWGESPADPDFVLPKRPGRKPKIPRPNPSAYDAGPDALSVALAEAGTGKWVHPSGAQEQVIWLPSVGDRPAACDALLTEPPDPRAKVTLLPWNVTTFQLGLDDTIALLGASRDQHVLAPGVAVGYDVRYWATALRFAGALVARQQFLPGLEERDGAFRACWDPICVGPDAERLAQLAAAMPDACRAFTEERVPAPDTPAREVLDAFLRDVVDYLVRHGVARVALPKLGPRGFESIHDRWSAALRSPDGVMEGDEDELREMAAAIGEWRRPLAAAASAPFRLCFRLDEPFGPEPDEDVEDGIVATGVSEPWEVTYLLQATDDPSLLIPAEDAWNAGTPDSNVPRGAGRRMREYMLPALGQASGLSPQIEQSLMDSTPAGYETDEPGAYEFLSVTAPALEHP